MLPQTGAAPAMRPAAAIRPRPAAAARAGLFPWVPVLLSVGIALWFWRPALLVAWQWAALALLVAAALDISHRTVMKIRQNLFWAFAYNVAGIPLAALGYLSPVVAGAAMALSSVSVMANALLLKRWRM